MSLDQERLEAEAALEGAAPGKVLSPEARRALEDAAARRKAQTSSQPAPEVGGPAGEEPTRFGDWERRGIATDF